MGSFWKSEDGRTVVRTDDLCLRCVRMRPGSLANCCQIVNGGICSIFNEGRGGFGFLPRLRVGEK
jgi:hypothetical protein